MRFVLRLVLFAQVAFVASCGVELQGQVGPDSDEVEVVEHELEEASEPEESIGSQAVSVGNCYQRCTSECKMECAGSEPCNAACAVQCKRKCIRRNTCKGNCQLAPVSVQSNLQETISTDGESTDTFIVAANLQDGSRYLLLYSAAFGGKLTSAEIGVRVAYGDTVIARASGEGSSSGYPRAMRTGSLHGFAVLQADGTSDLRIVSTVYTASNVYIKGKSLIAVPLDDLKEGCDYWVTQTNGDEPTVVTSHGLVELASLAVKVPSSGFYLVLMSAEGWVPNGDRFEGEAFQAIINSVPQKLMMTKEWETNEASRSFSYARLHWLERGATTLALAVGSAQGRADKAFRRGRIIMIRGSSFDQLVAVRQDEPVVTLANYPDYDNYLRITYEPSRAEDVVIIGNTFAWQGEIFRSLLLRLRNETTGTDLSEFISDDAKDIKVDTPALSIFGVESVDAPTTFALDMAGESVFSTSHTFRAGDLIVWSMTRR